MPTYSYECRDCKAVTDHVAPIAKRKLLQRCGKCGGAAEFRFSPPQDTTAREIRAQGVIHDERELGKDWRDKGTNRQPGGAGQKLYFHG